MCQKFPLRKTGKLKGVRAVEHMNNLKQQFDGEIQIRQTMGKGRP
jgi:hypothetical protein